MRRKYPTSTETRGRSSCCTAAENSQLYPRLPNPRYVSGSTVVLGTRCPNREFDSAPHSPFAEALVRSQSGMKFPDRGSPGGYKRSFHARVAESASTWVGLPAMNRLPLMLVRYLFALALMAVLPLPNRSYAAP